ncbi:MAG: NUDIX domain-containing protein [Ignavibacteriales bacterium]|nr:NUDIX domain-containing protein [Ignavibacteriales bacterium]
MNITSSLIEAHIFRKVENEIEFLLLRRSSNEIYGGLWQMVSGSTNENEKAFQAALREIMEETGLTPLKFWTVPNVNSFYSSTQNEICMIPVFAALVSNEAEVRISDEHSECRWVNLAETLKLLAWPGQRKSVEIIYEYFINQINFLNFVEISL